MKIRNLALILAAGLGVMGPVAAEACAISRPLPAEVLAEDAAAEGRAWEEASLVYVARVTDVPDNAFFRLEPVVVLKGRDAPAVFDAPPTPSRGMCLFYHGLNMGHGGWIGDEFVIYAYPPEEDRDPLIVSVRMLGDPATRAALQRMRPEVDQ